MWIPRGGGETWTSWGHRQAVFEGIVLEWRDKMTKKKPNNQQHKTKHHLKQLENVK